MAGNVSWGGVTLVVEQWKVWKVNEGRGAKTQSLQISKYPALTFFFQKVSNKYWLAWLLKYFLMSSSTDEFY